MTPAVKGCKRKCNINLALSLDLIIQRSKCYRHRQSKERTKKLQIKVELDNNIYSIDKNMLDVF